MGLCDFGACRYNLHMSDALDTFRTALKHADRLIAGTKTGPGKPSAQEGSMFVASVALTYAAWECYIEDVAIEVVTVLADEVDSSKVPDSVRSALEKTKPSTWQLIVHPGWRELWKALVKAAAKGDEESATFGMNTARIHQIIRFYELVGLDPLQVLTKDEKSRLEALVTARSAVVHTATAPTDFKKAKATEYRELVDTVAAKVDEGLRAGAASLTGTSPWP